MSRIFSILLILFAIAVFVFYINPTYTGKIVSDQQQIQSYNQALAAAASFSQKENELVQQRDSIPAASISRLEQYLPDGVDNVQLIVDLDSLAQRSGITLSDFVVNDNQQNTAAGSGSAGDTTDTSGSSAGTPSLTTSTGGPTLESTSLTNSLTISVTATGTYDSFRTFLAAAEQSLRPLDVTEIVVRNSGTGVYAYTITFQIYWLQ